jgi:dTMP kinase
MHPRTELLLYNASRAQLVEELIKPALAENTIVLCDRFADSTLAYQGYGHGLDLAELRKILDFATGGLKPDCTVYLDINAEVGLQRREKAAAAGEEWTRMDAQKLTFHQRVEEGYRRLIEQDQDRWIVIDAQGDIKDIQHRIQAALLPRLPSDI